MAMTGSSTTVAPRPASRSTSSDPWDRARVTTTRGRRGGGLTAGPAGRPVGAEVQCGHRADDDGGRGRQVDRGQPGQGRTGHLLAGVVPQWTTATGVSGPRPLAISSAAIRARSAMPMRITSVPPVRPSASQSTPTGAEASPTWPVTTVTDVARPRWVTGMPAAAGAAKAELTPGTTS